MFSASFKISRRFFLLGLASIYIAKNSSLIESIALSGKEVLPDASNSAKYKWIIDKDDL